MPGFLRGLAEEMRQEVRREVVLRWQELRALEIVWAEVRGEFDGEDAVHPELRREAQEAAQKLRELGRQLGLRRLEEPAEALVDQVRDCLDHAFKLLNLVEL